jgi:hypothetical protein
MTDDPPTPFAGFIKTNGFRLRQGFGGQVGEVSP